MNFGELLKKILLFISAYFPLFVILMIKYFSSFTNLLEIVVVTVVLLLTITSLVFWRSLLKNINLQTSEDYEILDYKREINYPMSYLLAYIVSIIGFDLSSWLALVAFMALLILLFVVYSNSDVLFLNPLLYVWGYKFYNIKARRTGLPDQKDEENHLHALLISQRSRFQTREKIALHDLSPGVMIETKKVDEK